MPALSPCWSSNELEQFLLGLTDEDRAAEIEAHLSGCPRCRQHMASLGAEDELVAALRGPAGRALVDPLIIELNEPPAELVDLLIPQFKQIADSLEPTVDFAGSDTNATPPDELKTQAPTVTFPSEPDVEFPRQLGRYEIRGLLGRGGMGTVLRGFDPLLNRSVAIKVLQTEWMAEEGMAEQLIREAQAAATVEHDHIVSIYAVELQQGNPCIVMPLLKGMTLNQRLEQAGGPLSAAEVLRISREAASGLAAAHASGLVHCDVKPGNLWLESPQGRVKILDFGLAVEHEDGKEHRGGISGTPGYLAPEQATGGVIDQRTDLFSLGCVMYRMATGRAPFTGEARQRALWTVLSDPPTAASELNPECPAEVSALIGRMLSREANERPATATEVVAALDAFERRLADDRSRLIRRRWLLATLSAALLGGGSVGTWAMMTAPRPARPVPVTLLGDVPAVDVVLHREGREWLLTPGPDTTLPLLPGEYRVRPATPSDQRHLVPEQFVVAAGQARVVRIAFVGEIARHAQHTQMVAGAAVLPSAIPPVIFSVGQDRALVQWDPSQEQPPRFATLSYAARCVAVAPDGNEIATAGGNKSLPQDTLIELRNPQRIDGPVRKLESHTRIISALAYSPDGRWLASACAEGVLLWDRATGTSERLHVASLEGTPLLVTSLAFTRDSRRLLTGGEQVTQWEISTLQSRHVVPPGAGLIRAVACLQQGFAAAGDDGIVRIWADIDSKPRESASVGCPILSLAATNEGSHVLTGDASGRVRLWNAASGELVSVLTGHSRPVHAVAFVGDGRRAVSAGADGTVRLYQLPFF